MSRPKPTALVIAAGALLLVLGVLTFVPRGGAPDGALAPTGDRSTTAIPTGRVGLGTVTPAMRAEIDRVVAEGRAVGRVSARTTPARLATTLVRCADFEGQRYCLGTGWTERSQAQVQSGMATAARRIAARAAYGRAPEDTGDLDALGMLQRQARLSVPARAAAERDELTRAARAVAKVWMLRHEVEGEALPAGFLADHPEVQTTSAPAGRTTSSAGSTSTQRKTRADYPWGKSLLDPKEVRSQSRTYWCGPTTMQMIVWGWSGRPQSQAHWANRLGTTTSGTGIGSMVKVVNDTTGWDKEKRAGPYIVLDIGDWSFGKWMLLQMRHYVDYRAPIVLHPLLHKEFYPYLDDDASGHFQVGRGYRKRDGRVPLLGYFEPWNQQRFDPSEPYIERVQWRGAYRSYRANEAHSMHDIGV